MTVYVDKAANRFGRMVMSHMIADTEEELHALAHAIGMKRSWFQQNASTPHYDVSRTRRAMAIEAGAVELDRPAFVEVIRRIRAQKTE